MSFVVLTDILFAKEHAKIVIGNKNSDWPNALLIVIAKIDSEYKGNLTNQ